MNLTRNPVPSRAPASRFGPIMRLAVVAFALAVVAAACGSSDDESATSTTEPASATTVAAEPTAFCDALVQVDAAFAAGGPEGPDPATLQSAFQAAQESAPEAIAADVDRAIELSQEAFSADPEAEPPAELEEVDGRIDAYALDNCNLEDVAVTGVDYSYQGIPASLASGRTAFSFTNNSASGEFHELIVLRLNDDTTESVDELLMLPMEEALSKVSVMAAAFAPQGATDVTFADLTPGRYVVACFIPVGSIGDAQPSEDAPPHAAQGMVAQFTVT